ncbi:class I SAM-dependent methyltransferase [Streptomyces sp. NPDC060035]|uniref:class I SAM-dependent methyltransferase n=1 Tax=Streptomyces sp. NPDC060035 TaxID=3347044 RepID=UPI0036B80D8D
MSQDRWSAFRTAWGQSAQGYDSLYGHGVHSEAEHAAWLLLLRRLLPTQDTPLKVLDVGTGTGMIALLVAELGHEVTGSDYSEAMLEVASRKAKESTKELNISFVHADALLDGIADEQFDVVICRHLLWAVSCPEEALRRWKAVCRPGGKIVVIDQLRPRVNPVRQGIRELADVLNPLIGSGDSHDGVFPKIPLHEQPLKRATSPLPIANAMRRAGLVRVQGERLPWIDAVERPAMPRLERWARRWNRYVVEGWV